MGTVHLKVDSAGGYTATMKLDLHKPIMKPSMQELPAWCVDNFYSDTPNEGLNTASLILLWAAKSDVQLDPYEGSPAPVAWTPTIEVLIPSVVGLVVADESVPGGHLGKVAYSGRGTCSAYSISNLTSAGFKNTNIHLMHGRSTPSDLLPKTIEEVPFRSDGFTLSVKDAAECTVLPNDQFEFSNSGWTNTSEKNNRDCDFMLTQKTAA